ncbi:hypothetical protein [Streptomyces sp. NPDC001980]|uniref:hypothetical protein n=1 Tax=Streptomyces sp. NPDC001980 TaxID=3157126 RepID=UPI0033322B87
MASFAGVPDSPRHAPALPREEASGLLRGHLDTGPRALEEKIDTVVARGRVTEDTEGCLALT